MWFTFPFPWDVAESNCALTSSSFSNFGVVFPTGGDNRCLVLFDLVIVLVWSPDFVLLKIN